MSHTQSRLLKLCDSVFSLGQNRKPHFQSGILLNSAATGKHLNCTLLSSFTCSYLNHKDTDTLHLLLVSTSISDDLKPNDACKQGLKRLLIRLLSAKCVLKNTNHVIILIWSSSAKIIVQQFGSKHCLLFIQKNKYFF